MFKIRNNFDEPQLFDEILTKFRMMQYALMHEMMAQFMSSALIWKLFTLLETFQLLYYTFHPQMPFAYTIIWYEYLLEVIKYFQLNYIITQSAINVALLYIFLVLLLILFGLWVACSIRLQSDRKISAFFSYSMKILSFFGLCQNTFLALPIINVFVVIIICDSASPYTYGEECYQGLYIMHVAFAIIGVVVYGIMAMMLGYLYMDMNPFSNTPIASPQQRLNIYRIIYKTAVLCYITLDYEGNVAVMYLILITLAYALFLIHRVRCPKYYDESVQKFTFFCDVMLFLVTFFFLLQVLIQPDSSLNVGLFYMIFCTPLCYVTIYLALQEKDSYLLRRGAKNIHNDDELESFIIQVLDLLAKGEHLQNRIKLEGLVVQHMQFCHTPGCPCLVICNEKINEEIPPLQVKHWYQFVEAILIDSLVRFPKSIKLHLLNAFLQKDRLHNRFKSLQSLIAVQDLGPNFQEEFTLYRCKYELETEMMDDELRMVEGKTVDVVSIIKFQSYFVEFQRKLSTSVKCHHEFWTELMEESPDSMKLQGLGSQITQSVDEVEEVYKRLIALNPSHIRCLQTYGYFQKDIINNDIEGPRILEKADQLAKSLQASQMADTMNIAGDGGDTCTLTVSGNHGQLGQILNSTREIHRILGYSKADVLGQNISRLMPRVIGEAHDSFVKRYFETNESNVIARDRLVLAQNRQGLMVPCMLMIKVLPNLEHGVKLIGFLKKLVPTLEEEEQLYILYNPSTFQVYGLSTSCQSKLNLSPQMITATYEFTLNNILPDTKILEEKQNDPSIAFILNFNTATINQMFVIESGESDLEPQQLPSQHSEQFIAPQATLEQYNWKMKCNVVKYNYGDLHLHLLKFHEQNDLLENQKQSHKSENQMETKRVKNKKSKAHQTIKNRVDAQEYENEDRSSLNSVSSSLNDDMRSLKDFKALISERIVPKQIRNLQITLFALTMVLISIESIDLYLKHQQTEQFQTSVRFLEYSYYRQLILSDVTFYTRMIELTATGQYKSNEMKYFHANLTEGLANLQENQYEIIKNRIELEQADINLPEEQQYSIINLMQNNGTYSQNMTIEQATFQLVNQGVIVVNLLDAQFDAKDTVSTADKSVSFILENGMYTLREAAEEESTRDLEAFNDLINTKVYIFMIFLILNVFFLVMAQFILVPVLRNVRISNIKVLSLFGLIPIAEIKDLAGKCETYLKTYLDEATTTLNVKPDEPIKVTQPKKVEAPANEVSQLKSQANNMYFEVNNEDLDAVLDKPLEPPQLKSNGEQEVQAEADPAQPIEEPFGNQVQKTKQQVEQEQQQQEMEELRVEKLQAYRSSNSSNLFVKLTVFLLLFCGYFVMQYVLEFLYLNNMRTLAKHMQLSHFRPIIIKYSLYFGLEASQVKSSRNNKLESDYHTRLYLNDRDLFEQLSSSFPTQFKSYLSDFNTLNYENICENIDMLSVSLTKKWCENVYNGILQKGLRTSIVSLALDTQDAFSQSKKSSDTLNGSDFQQLLHMLTFITPFLNYLNLLFVQSLIDFTAVTYTIDTIILSTFIAGWVLLVLVIWIPHLARLSTQIWRTKGMLNLIPLSIIQKYDRLKDAFLHSNILQMVK